LLIKKKIYNIYLYKFINSKLSMYEKLNCIGI